MHENAPVTVLEEEGRVLHIVGTAHVSSRSVEEVREVIRRVRPDVVCVELDRNRYEALTDESRWSKLDIFQVIRQKKVPFLIVSLALAAYQARLGEKLGSKPGAEMLAAIEEAREVGAEVVLADRDIQITLKRTWGNLSFWQKLKLIWALTSSAGEDIDISDEQLEELKRGESLHDMLQEFAEHFAEVKEPLIDERDRYLMSKVESAEGERIVAVVGAAHVPGMVKSRGAVTDLAELEKLPSPGYVLRLLKWVIPAIVLAAFYVGYQRHAGEGLQDMLRSWVLPNAVFAGLFSLVAGARLVSVLTAVVASPITSLNPTIAAGMIVGLVEAWLRKPTVEDCERVREDAQSFKGFYRNPFTRVLLVSLAASLGSALGAWVGLAWIFKLLHA